MNMLGIMGYVFIVTFAVIVFAWFVWVTESILDIKTYNEHSKQETVPAVPLDRIEQAREEIKSYCEYAADANQKIAFNACLIVLDRLITEEDE